MGNDFTSRLFQATIDKVITNLIAPDREPSISYRQRQHGRNPRPKYHLRPIHYRHPPLNLQDVKEKCVCGLLESVGKSGKEREELGIPRKMWMGIGEFDPDDEIAGPMKAFAGKWKEVFGEEGLTVEILKGHNHISPPMSLMSGDEEGEKWGEDIVKWIEDA